MGTSDYYGECTSCDYFEGYFNNFCCRRFKMDIQVSRNWAHPGLLIRPFQCSTLKGYLYKQTPREKKEERKIQKNMSRVKKLLRLRDRMWRD